MSIWIPVIVYSAGEKKVYHIIHLHSSYMIYGRDRGTGEYIFLIPKEEQGVKRGKHILYLAGLFALAFLSVSCAARHPAKTEDSPEEKPAHTETEQEAPDETETVIDADKEPAPAEQENREDNEADSSAKTDEIAPDEDVKEQMTGTMVRVSIRLATPSVTAAGYKLNSITTDPKAQAYQAKLVEEQEEIARRIEEVTGHPLDVVYSFTLSSNAISANVYSFDIDKILSVEGVVSVSKEQLNQPHG